MPIHTTTNGVPEWKNHTTLEMVYAMLQEKNMPIMAVYLINGCMTEGVYNMTPHEKNFKRKLNLSYTMVFGSIAYVHIPDEKMNLISYSFEQKGYTCFNTTTQQSQIS